MKRVSIIETKDVPQSSEHPLVGNPELRKETNDEPSKEQPGKDHTPLARAKCIAEQVGCLTIPENVSAFS